MLGDDFFTNVTELDLSRTEIADEGLTHLEWLPRLRSLSLGERVTDAGVQYLERLPQLRTLKLARTQITDAGIQRLQKALPSCTIRR